MTLAEFKQKNSRSGESVMGMAYLIAEHVTDDPELLAAARAALEAEDEFDKMLNDRGIER